MWFLRFLEVNHDINRRGALAFPVSFKRKFWSIIILISLLSNIFPNYTVEKYARPAFWVQNALR